MKAFEFDHQIITTYERFSRSFASIRAEDLKKKVDEEYTGGRFWPEALLSINPHFLAGKTVDELVAAKVLDEATAQIFRINGKPLEFHKHQDQAIAKAKAGKSFVVTTGTGSGKSLCFFVPVVDAIVKARRAGSPRKTRAIIIYPMNALANSQIKEIEKFISQSGLSDHLRPVVKRYTGQESQEERHRIADNPPDILLTNFMMAELLLTRQDAVDAKVIDNATGLEFIVLDELHTYRGRQGADVAVLVRRLKDRCCPERPPLCIGTSATMASEGTEDSKAKAVAYVASRLFGVDIGPESVIDESLRRVTDDRINLKDAKSRLPEVVSNPFPSNLDDEALRRHPLAIWTELVIGLEDKLELKRKKPVPLGEAANQLAIDSGLPSDACLETLQTFLTVASLPDKDRGGKGEAAFLAFKLHRFISGAGEVYSTLTAAPRTVLLEGQLEDPNNPGHRLYPTRFCRKCGQDYHVVTKTIVDGETTFLPRNIDDQPLSDPVDDDVAGYLCPDPGTYEDFAFDGSIDGYPESWKDEAKGIEKLRSARKRQSPIHELINTEGRTSSSGRAFWFIPGKFGFCLCCQDEPTSGARERTKLAGLSGEGRSSATTLLVSSALEWLNSPNSGVSKEKRKLLGFTDNRQDAALQSGHFNDFIFVSLLRGAILRAILKAGEDGLTDDEFGLKVTQALGFTQSNKSTFKHWMLKSEEAGSVDRENAQRALAKVLAHRVWTDLRRGWRFTNPSLSVLNLIDVEFIGLDELAADTEKMIEVLPELGGISSAPRAKLLRLLLGAMLEGLAVQTEALDLTVLDGVAEKSRQVLRTPWAIDQKEDLRSRAMLILRASSKDKVALREEKTLLRAGPTSRIARLINKKKLIGTKLKRDQYFEFMERLLSALALEGMVTKLDLDTDLTGWRLNPSAVRLRPGPALTDESKRGNRYFHDLYTSIEEDLKKGESSFWGLEGREHTAQVTQKMREWREWRFRYGDDDRNAMKEAPFREEIKQSGESAEFLPALFCSPTMELGVDISALNAVYLRNVPPTPANYAQRAGRAGRSGQPAVIVTYCAAGSPHDQYFFERRNEMVSGVVRPPALDITNEELVRSHLHAVWLAEAKLALSPDIPEVLAINKAGYPIKEDIRLQITNPALVPKAEKAMKRLLRQILAADEGRVPGWMGDPDNFVLDVASKAPKNFDQAFERWRELYRSAQSQLKEANQKSEIAGLSAADRRKVKVAQAQASDQLAILEQGKATNGSDFYTYRYLATEGFLPGYNFPRLPLYAFVPGEGKTGTYLSRARFLAISEFGPRSLIYHEGRAYRVARAKLPPEARADDGSSLATKDIYVCPNCGGAHEGEVERCHACDGSMAGQIPVKDTLRIDNVEATTAERITANDEERVRQGFEIQTVFSWPNKGGAVRNAEFKCDETTIFSMQYANSAEISRLNKGLKRRRKKTVNGFYIDPRTGYWAKEEDEDGNSDDPPDASVKIRIVPIVRDRKNALLFRFHDPETHEQATITTVQHALIRAIEVVHQLEEGEVLGEPLPARDNRRAILAYEASEGGAGVLTRLIDDPAAIGVIARKALDLMHYKNIAAAVAAGNTEALVDDGKEACVRGCYRCLLSYYNQPDHELIDRRSPAVVSMLIDLVRGQTVPTAGAGLAGNAGGWQQALASADLPLPDTHTLLFAGTEIELVWKAHLVAATTKAITPDLVAAADAKGFQIIQLPADPDQGIPEALVNLLKG